MLQIAREQLVKTAVWHKANGRLADAAECLRQVIARHRDDAGAHYDLGVMLAEMGRSQEAEECFRETIRLKPDLGDAYNELGNLRRAHGQLEDAAACYQKAIELQPGLMAARANLGSVRETQGRYPEAAEHLRAAVQMAPNHAGLRLILGTCLTQMGPGHLEEALVCYRKSVELEPNQAALWYNAAFTLQQMGRLDEAMGSYRKAVQIKPDLAEAWNNLGVILGLAGEHQEAAACLRRSLELRPDRAQAHSSLLYELHFDPKIDARSLLREHEMWGQRHANPLMRRGVRLENDRNPERRLRVGYISPDFRMNAVGRFMLPLLQAHDRQRVEVVCYADLNARDEFTARLRAHADKWREITEMNDEAVAEMIARDKVDILVDLAMHMKGNRLPALARKPAPVQVSYLATCSTTGMKAMDYRITDRYMDPPGRDMSVYSEQSVLVERYWSYRALEEAPEVDELPMLRGEPPTFGCLNHFGKVSREALRCWERILKEVPESKLALYPPMESHRERIKEFIEKTGIEPWRIVFVGRSGVKGRLDALRGIDIALEPFFWGSRTMTCDAMWMGVPVVTLAGEKPISRRGASILSHAGLPELIAETEDAYTEIAVCLAKNAGRLAKMREEMRDRLRGSALMDGAATARGLEEAYRGMWRKWCEG
jgi:protein O-GlcNAc transferase